MTGPLSEYMRREPSLRMARATYTRDNAMDMGDERQRHEHQARRILGEQIARFLLDENIIEFETKKYDVMNETTILASLWTVASNSPNLNGRKADMFDARLQGRAEAAREILEAFTVYSAHPTTARHWSYAAHDMIMEVEENRRG